MCHSIYACFSTKRWVFDTYEILYLHPIVNTKTTGVDYTQLLQLQASTVVTQVPTGSIGPLHTNLRQAFVKRQL